MEGSIMQNRMVPMVRYPQSVEALPDTAAARDVLLLLLSKVQQEPERWPCLPDSEARLARAHPHPQLPELRVYYKYDDGVIYLYGVDLGDGGAGKPAWLP
jgi:hypothetical protein